MPTLLANQIQNNSNGDPWRCSWLIGLMPFISTDQTRSLSGCAVLLIMPTSCVRMHLLKRYVDEKYRVSSDTSNIFSHKKIPRPRVHVSDAQALLYYIRVCREW